MKSKYLGATITILLSMSLFVSAAAPDQKTTDTAREKKEKVIKFLRKHKVDETPTQTEVIDAIYKLSRER